MSPNTSSTPRSQLAADLRSLIEPLRVLVSTLQPKDVPLCWAPEVLDAFIDGQRILESGRVLMAARAIQAKQWEHERFASPGDWLADRMGTSNGRARADLETSERLEGLEATSDAMRAGELSPEQAGAVSDAAAVNPDAEQDLLDTARRDSLRRTKREAERRKAEAQTEAEKAARDERVRKERNVDVWYGGGAGTLKATGPVADISELEQIIRRHVDQAFKQKRPPESRGTRGNYAFDALMGLARGGGQVSTKAPVTRLTLVRVDLAALQRGAVSAGEVCEIGGVSVSVTELRQLLGDSVLQLVLTNGEAVIDVVNLARKPTVAQKIARLWSHPTCCVEGCDRSVRIEFDHRTPWATAQVTELDNLDPACDHHHALKTHEDWALIDGTGRRPMVPPDDHRHPDRTRRPDDYEDTG